jgi:hypothetical protein
MKQNQETRNLYSTFVSNINKLDAELQEHIKKIKIEHKENLNSEKKKLLIDIAKGENLDYNKLKKLYLIKNSDNEKLCSDSDNESELLNKIVLNDIDYYYENKNDGKIYNTNSEEVGVYKNNQFILN